MPQPSRRGFSGEVAEHYARYRRGYPPRVLDGLVDAFGLTSTDVAIDLGCGTGQLTLPLSERVGAVIGIDPEPDMLRLASEAAHQRSAHRISWMLGFDTDLPALGALLAPRSVAAVTVATAIHWMDHRALFANARSLLRDGGGIAIITNGAPLWLQDADWSRALRTVLQEWTGRDVGWACGTDEESRAGYRDELISAGYAVDERRIDYAADLDLEHLIGGLFSAMSNDDVADPRRRDDLAARVRAGLAPASAVEEHVSVVIQTGTARSG